MSKYILQVCFQGRDGYKIVRHGISEYFKHLLGDGASSMLVAFNEAVNNAIEYGCRDTEHPVVSVRIGIIKGRRLIIRVKDSGGGFKLDRSLCLAINVEKVLAESILAESGRGILLMKQFSDQIFYNRPGNEVLLMRRIP